MGVKRISHRIGGKAVSGTSGRSGPVFDPASGIQTAEVDFATADEVVARSTWPPTRPRWRSASPASLPRSCSASASCVDAPPRRPGRGHHRASTARCSTTPGRGRPRPRVRRVRVRHPAPAEGRAQLARCRPGVDVHTVSQPLGVVAGITPFNFPVMVPLWMLPNALACGNAFVLKPSEKDPSASMLLAELVHRGRLPRRRLQRRAGRRRGGRRAPRPTPTSTRCRSSAARRSRATSTRPARATASGSRRSAARRTTWSCCPTPTSTPPPTPRSRPPTARPGSAAWRSRSSSRSATVADPLVDAIAERIPDVCVGPGDDPTVDDGPAHHRRAPRPGRGRTSNAADEGATVVVDGRARAFARRRLLRRRARCSTTSSPAWRATTTRSSDRC